MRHISTEDNIRHSSDREYTVNISYSGQVIEIFEGKKNSMLKVFKTSNPRRFGSSIPIGTELLFLATAIISG